MVLWQLVLLILVCIFVYVCIWRYVDSLIRASNGDYDQNAKWARKIIDIVPTNNTQRKFESAYLDMRGDNIPVKRVKRASAKVSAILQDPVASRELDINQLQKIQQFAAEQRLYELDIMTNIRSRDVISANVTNYPGKDTSEKIKNAANTWKSDMQNVHDSSVQNGLMNVLTRYIEHSPDLDVDSEINWLKNTVASDKQLLDVVNLSNIGTENVGKYDMPERNILAYVTAYSKTNGRRLANLLNSIRDCNEGNGIVCTTGRVSRYLNSQVGNDDDPVLASGVMTFAAYRNEYLNTLNAIITRNPQISDDELENAIYDNAEMLLSRGVSESDGEKLVMEANLLLRGKK